MKVKCAWGKCKYNKNGYCSRKDIILDHEIVTCKNNESKFVDKTFLKCENFAEKEMKM